MCFRKEPIAVAQSVQQHPQQRIAQPRIIDGADDQAAAYDALITQWHDADQEQDVRNWQRICAALEQTRHDLYQRPLFVE